MTNATPPRGVRRDGTSEGQVNKSGGILKLVALVAILSGGFLLAQFTPLGQYLTRAGIADGIEVLRGSMWAPVIFIATSAGATAMAIPGTLLTLAGGALFGVSRGIIFNSIAANLGANLAFLMARHLGRAGIGQLLRDKGEKSPALERLDEVTRKHGFRGLLMLRLIPIAPFNVLNFGSGLLAISWPSYALATVIGILPGTVVFTFFADALLQGSQEASHEALIRVLIAGGFLALLSVLPLILKRMGINIPGAAAREVRPTFEVRCRCESES